MVDRRLTTLYKGFSSWFTTMRVENIKVQRLKEQELVKKFYSDEIPKEENDQDANNIENKVNIDQSKN